MGGRVREKESGTSDCTTFTTSSVILAQYCTEWGGLTAYTVRRILRGKKAKTQRVQMVRCHHVREIQQIRGEVWVVIVGRGADEEIY